MLCRSLHGHHSKPITRIAFTTVPVAHTDTDAGSTEAAAAGGVSSSSPSPSILLLISSAFDQLKLPSQRTGARPPGPASSQRRGLRVNVPSPGTTRTVRAVAVGALSRALICFLHPGRVSFPQFCQVRQA